MRFPDGTPVEGVPLDLEPHCQRATTDAVGRFKFEDVPAGGAVLGSFHLDEDRPVQSGETGVDLVLRRHLVRFRVVDEAGTPVRGHSYDVSATEPSGRNRRCTGFGGQERISPFAAESGARLVVRCTLAGYRNAVVVRVLEGEPGYREVEVVMRRPGPPGAVLVRVATDAAAPPEHAFLDFLDASGAPEEGLSGMRVALQDGRGRIDAVPDGTYEVSVSTGFDIDVTHFGLEVRRSLTVVADRETALDATVPSGGRLVVTPVDAAGTVLPSRGLRLLDDRGRPVEMRWGVPIERGMSYGESDAATVHGIPPLPPGPYVLRYVQIPEGKEVVVAEQQVVVAWRETVTVELRVTK